MDTPTEEPCCDDQEPHYHCATCNDVVGIMGHVVPGGRIICDPQERRAYLGSLAAQDKES